MNLANRGDSGVQILSWYHRQFWRAAENRYIKNKQTEVLLHTGLADYFMGRWSGGMVLNNCFGEGVKQVTFYSF
jgi:hypothetical protein